MLCYVMLCYDDDDDLMIKGWSWPVSICAWWNFTCRLHVLLWNDVSSVDLQPCHCCCCCCCCCHGNHWQHDVISSNADDAKLTWRHVRCKTLTRRQSRDMPVSQSLTLQCTTPVFTARCYAERAIFTASRPSVRLWRWGIVSHRLHFENNFMADQPGLSSQQTPTPRIYIKGNTPKFWPDYIGGVRK